MDPPSQEAIELGLNTAEPATLVVDLNCAFASIEQQHDPALRGRPLAIAAYATDAATIVSSSREARDLGIKTGMRVFEAKAIFPSILVREPDPPLYRSVSDKLIEIMQRHSPDVLRMSIDEASMNLAGTPGLKKIGPEGVGQSVKGAIRDEVGECLTASVGISTSIWMAKQASNLDKRDGLQRIDHTNLVSVFERLRLTDLSGIAEASARRLAGAGILTPVQFLRATPPRLRLVGMHAEVARGWSMRLRGFEVGGFETARRKSYSHSHVMARATASQGHAYASHTCSRRRSKSSADPPRSSTATAVLRRKQPTDVVCAGIGENGHLAFNDPPVADFLDNLEAADRFSGRAPTRRR